MAAGYTIQQEDTFLAVGGLLDLTFLSNKVK